MRLLLPALALAPALGPSTRTTAPPLQLFVSTAGDDAASGGLASPFRTVRRAQAAVRAAAAAGSAAGGIAVNLRGGTYSQHDGSVLLALTAADSGTAAAPIVWRAYGGEDVVLSAGLTVPPAAFRPRPGHSGQLQANLTALGLVDLGQIGRWAGPAATHGDGNLTGPFPAPLQGRRAWNGVGMAELFWAGSPATLARWPNTGPDGGFVWSRTAAGYPPNCAGTAHEPQQPQPGARTPCVGFTSGAPFSNSSAQLAAWAAEAAERDPALHGYWK